MKFPHERQSARTPDPGDVPPSPETADGSGVAVSRLVRPSDSSGEFVNEYGFRCVERKVTPGEPNLTEGTFIEFVSIESEVSPNQNPFAPASLTNPA